jgi:hypothetical protein
MTYLMASILDTIPPHLWDYDEGFDAVKVTDEEILNIFNPPHATNEAEGYVQSWHVRQESIKRLGFDFPIILVSMLASYDTTSFIKPAVL